MDSLLFTFESVNEGHHDKLCDQISDAILDACLDPDNKVVCDTYTKKNMVMVFGEITTKANVDYEKIIHNTYKEVGFISDDVGLDADNYEVLVDIKSPNISQGIHGHLTKMTKEIRASNQDHMYGSVNDEITRLMPLTHVLASKLGAKPTKVRKNGTCPWLRPNGKNQVTIERNDAGSMVPQCIHTFLIFTQHDEIVTNDHITTDLKQHVIKHVIPKKY
eukprot:Gb_16879 [translate_table: standard]